MAESNGTAPGPAAVAVPDNVDELIPSPTWNGLAVETTDQAMLASIDKRLSRIEEAFSAIADGIEKLTAGGLMGMLR